MEKLNSDGYLSIMVNILETHKLTENIYFMCTDGAPVVCSSNKGLYGKLKKKWTISITIFISWSLFLILKKKLELSDLNYHKIVGVDEDESISYLIKPLDIRWKSYFPSIKRLALNYSTVLKTMQ